MPKDSKKSAAVSIGAFTGRKGRKAKPKPKPTKRAKVATRPPDFDLLDALKTYAIREYEDAEGNPFTESLKYDAVINTRAIPSLTLAVCETLWLRLPAAERKVHKLAAVHSLLLEWGLDSTRSDPDVAAYCVLRAKALTADYADPASRVRLRAWSKRSSYSAPAAHGGTEDTSIRTTRPVSNSAGGLAAELGITKAALVAALIAGQAARLAPTPAESEALAEQFDALLREIRTRHKELAERVKEERQRGPA